jgi:hypothetical protein
MLMCFLLEAQTTAEWLSQTATQKKYLILQITALQNYIGYLEKGYSIARTGLSTIANIKNVHLSLDKDFFASLQTINPLIGNDKRATHSELIAIAIEHARASAMISCSKNSYFTSAELGYINKVFTSVLDNSKQLIDDLKMVLSLGVFKMADNEREHRIDIIYNEMQDNYAFAERFKNECLIMAQQRVHEQKDTQLLGQLYGEAK